MASSVVYDKTKYHDESVAAAGLPARHACHHVAYFLRRLVERDLMSATFAEGRAGRALARYRSGRTSAVDLLAWWDGCLASDMLSDRGNAFARDYFDYDRGAYLSDYAELLQRDLPTPFHVRWTEENYAVLAARIDQRYAAWSG